MLNNLDALLIEKKDTYTSEPVIFDFSKEADVSAAAKLIESGKIQTTVDDYDEQQLELFGIKNPTKVYTPTFKEEFAAYYQNLKNEKKLHTDGKWVYFPWLCKLVHILNEDDFHLVRTARNKNLISDEEQNKFHNATIGIGGLSVGSSVAFALTLQGGPKHIKLADMDRLALSNTNRIFSGVDNLGILKVEMAARTMYEINPYLHIELFPEGLHPENIDHFFEGLDIIIDELDNIAVKYLIREKANQYKIPVLMATDNGDNALIDIERYDIDQNVKYFHGRMGEDLSYESLLKLDKFSIGKMAAKCVGVENVTIKMQESLLEMGKTIVSWPQLGGAAIINGIGVAYCVRKILNNDPLISDRAHISLDQLFIPNYNTEVEIEKRNQAGALFKNVFGL